MLCLTIICMLSLDLVITAENFSAQFIPNDVSEDGKRKLDVILKGKKGQAGVRVFKF